MKRAALIITDADRITGTGYEGEGWRGVAWFSERTSEQLLADLRTLVALPDVLRLDDDPPSILETPVTISNARLLAALEAADRVRALLPEGAGT